MIDLLLDGTGLIAADWSLAFLSVVAALASVWNVARRGCSFPNLAMLAGYTLFSLRLFYMLATGLDPLIPPVASICWSLIAIAWTLTALRHRPSPTYQSSAAHEVHQPR
jgi:hypothetical protein